MNATVLPHRLRPTRALGLATLLALAGCRSAAETAPDLVLANVTVIDGLGGAPTPGRTIEIRGGRITAIRAARPNETSEPAVAGHFVIPGLIDSHVHLVARY